MRIISTSAMMMHTTKRRTSVQRPRPIRTTPFRGLPTAVCNSAYGSIPQSARKRKGSANPCQRFHEFFLKFQVRSCKFLPIEYNSSRRIVASEASANHSDGRRAVCPATPRLGMNRKGPGGPESDFQTEQEDYHEKTTVVSRLGAGHGADNAAFDRVRG